MPEVLREGVREVAQEVCLEVALVLDSEGEVEVAVLDHLEDRVKAEAGEALDVEEESLYSIVQDWRNRKKSKCSAKVLRKFWLTVYREDIGSASDDPSEQNEEEDLEGDSSDEEDEDEPQAINSYAALMLSLVEDSGPQAKRRKLDHPSKPETKEEDNEAEDISDVEDVDHVDEPEEGPESAIEVDDDDESEDASDSFEVHFANPDQNILKERLSCLQRNQWSSQKAVLSTGAKVVSSCPQKTDVKPSIPHPITNLGGLKLKQKLVASMSKQMSNLDAVESSLAPFIFGNQDILYCERSPVNSESLRRLTCLHAINHVFK